MIGFLVTVVVVLLLAGLLCWGIKAFPWIDPPFKQAAIVVIIVVVGIWLIYNIIPFLRHLPAA